MTIDPITLEVVRGRIDVIAEEMQYAMIRSAYSNTVKEAADTSTALFTPEGELIAQASGIPILLGVLVPAVRSLIEAFPVDQMKENDAYMMNDPYSGGTHLPDIVSISPVIVDGTVIALSCVITHHVDVGGKTPGSLPVDATDIFQEGLRLPPLAYIREGVVDKSIHTILRANTRFPNELLGDLDAQINAGQLGAQRFGQLVRSHPRGVVMDCIQELLDRSEKLTRDELSRVPNGIYRFRDYLDSDGIDLKTRVPIEVAVTVSDEGLTFDFEGTSPQVKGPFNATPSSVLAAAFYTVRAITTSTIPNNGGCYRAISMKLPEASLVNPKWPAAVNARSMTFCALIDTIFGALASAAPEKIPAASYEYPVVSFGGFDEERQKPFVFLEFACGGLGGRPYKDGNDVFRSKAGNTLNSPVEATEMDFPLRVIEYALRPDSGGAGKYRGGLGSIKTFEVLRGEVTVSHRGDRHFTPPYGLQGGQPGSCSQSTLHRPDGTKMDIPGKLVFAMTRGDRLTVCSAGGGGFGKPEYRNPKAVAADIADGKVSAAFANRYFPRAVPTEPVPAVEESVN